MIKIYGYRLSPFVERIYQQVHAKGIEDKFDFCGLPDDGLKCEEYLTLNPFGKMPVLVDGDMCLPESAIICEYIESKFPDTPLMPANKDQHLAVNLILRMLDMYVFQNMFTASAMVREATPNKEAIKAKFDEVVIALDVIEKFASSEKNEFLVGDKWSLADCAFVSADFFFARILTAMGVDPYANRPKIKAWHDANKDTEVMKNAYGAKDKELVAFLGRIKEE